MPDVGELIDAAVASGGVPGAVASLGRNGDTLATCVAGWADRTPAAERRMAASTVFDVASLTKAVATTTVALALIGDGHLALDGAVTGYLPEACWPSAVTVRHLLTHTSGLPPSVKFYQWCDTREQVLHELYRTPLEVPPGTRYAYSDLGFIALGEVVAVVAGEPLDAAVRRLVTAPLGMNSTGFNPSGPPQRFAATELRDDGTPWTGVVHDENARAMGGVAGHAGLFSTAADLARFAQWWVSPSGGPVPVSLRREATACQTAGLSGCRGLGWVRQGDRYDILGGTWPPTAVSHTGFTGTSLALDPASGLWLVLLTNAVHLGRDATAIKALRRSVHAAVADLASLASAACPDLAEPLCAELAPIRELVVSVPAPRCDHRQHEDPALAQQVLIDTRIVPADFFGRMGEVEFDRPAATRLEVYEQQPVLRGEHVARMRLPVH